MATSRIFQRMGAKFWIHPRLEDSMGDSVLDGGIPKSFRYQKWRVSWSPYSLLFWGDVFSYICCIHPYSLHIPKHFRYLKILRNVTVFVGKQSGGAQHLYSQWKSGKPVGVPRSGRTKKDYTPRKLTRQ